MGSPLMFAVPPLAFLCGSVPTALILGRMKGIDVRKHGSGNIGATNAFRVLGKPLGILCLLLDIFKGWAPTFLFSRLAAPEALSMPTWMVLVGAFAILGHCFSPFVGFKGGKGVATSLGVFLGVAPAAITACFAVGAVLIAMTGYVSLGSITGAALLPFAVFAFAPSEARPWTVIGIAAAMGVFVIWKHRENIGRLRKGTENRIFKARPTPADGDGK